MCYLQKEYIEIEVNIKFKLKSTQSIVILFWIYLISQLCALKHQY